MSHSNPFMQEAIRLSFETMRNNTGGPFGAVIVKDGKIIARGFNKVVSTNDPTAHAEVVAIREACKVLNNFQLDGCELYTSCEPCPLSPSVNGERVRVRGLVTRNSSLVTTPSLATSPPYRVKSAVMRLTWPARAFWRCALFFAAHQDLEGIDRPAFRPEIPGDSPPSVLPRVRLWGLI